MPQLVFSCLLEPIPVIPIESDPEAGTDQRRDVGNPIAIGTTSKNNVGGKALPIVQRSRWLGILQLRVISKREIGNLPASQGAEIVHVCSAWRKHVVVTGESLQKPRCPMR